MIKDKFSVDEYVFATLNIYLDIINLFLLILQIMTSDDWKTVDEGSIELVDLSHTQPI